MTSLNQNTILIVECYLNFRWLVILEYETLSNIPFKFSYEKLYWSTLSFKIVLRENWNNTIHILSEYTKWLTSSSLSFVFIFSFFCYEYNFRVLKLIFKFFFIICFMILCIQNVLAYPKVTMAYLFSTRSCRVLSFLFASHLLLINIYI